MWVTYKQNNSVLHHTWNIMGREVFHCRCGGATKHRKADVYRLYLKHTHMKSYTSWNPWSRDCNPGHQQCILGTAATPASKKKVSVFFFKWISTKDLLNPTLLNEHMLYTGIVYITNSTFLFSWWCVESTKVRMLN